MNMTQAHETSTPRDDAAPHGPWRTLLTMIGLIVAFYLLREHGGHVAGLWPYLLLLACPLLHLFHHHDRHGHHGGHRGPTSGG